MPSAAFAGWNGQISASTSGTSGTFQLVGETRDATLTVTSEDIDVTSYNSSGWRERIPGLAAWEFTTESLFLMNNDEGQTSLWDSILAKQILFFRFRPKRVVGTPTGYLGRGFVNSFEVAVPVDDAVVLSMTIIGTAQLSLLTLNA